MPRSKEWKEKVRAKNSDGRCVWNLGKKATLEHRNNISTSLLVNVKREENSPNWKGNNVGYGALHDWVKRLNGKANKCEDCGTTTSRRYEWTNISGKYKRELGDWKQLCTRCHVITDGRILNLRNWQGGQVYV